MRSYHYDSQKRMFICPDHKGFPYSDGTEVEERLLSVIKHATDVSSSSQELIAAIEDWPSEYHLSPVRHNLLRFLELGPTHRILELGCGCGAITRHLGEAGATVVAVEGSARRAQIAAERCRDLANVSIYCDNLVDFSSEDKFDFVTLIGVLEYAPIFIQSDDPVNRCLGHARSFLKEDGSLILAIENQLGLKYFNGCAEDHIGRPFHGITDLYGPGEPITFGRHVVMQKLAQAGFDHQTFLLPFPDYKLPELIIPEAALSHPGFRVAELLHRCSAPQHCYNDLRSFFEPLAWRAIADNNLLADLANSFLVLAAQEVPSPYLPPRGWLASHYTANRLPVFATETLLCTKDDVIQVAKHPLYPVQAIDGVTLCGGRLIHRATAETDYLRGDLYVSELQKLLACGAGIESLAIWVSDWLRLLLEKARLEGARAKINGEWLDAIPANFVRLPDGSLARFDEEWDFDRDIPLPWVVIRGLVNAITVCPTSPALAGLSFRQVIDSTLVHAGFPVSLSDADYAEAALWEKELRQLVYGETQKADIFAGLSEERVVSMISGQICHEELARLEAEIRRIKSTVSWQITKPLRGIWNLLSGKLAGSHHKQP
ncbi:MAG: methyltransferase domain-containing protein [Burkholderiales bacterium]|nr:methyltransferase domain-containing protein [Burkholderiales bacterium]